MIGDPDATLGAGQGEPFSVRGGIACKALPSRLEDFISRRTPSNDTPPSELLRETVADWDLELKAKLLIVEGNIGVGKTTLTKKLANKLMYRVFLEPTTENPYLGESTSLVRSRRFDSLIIYLQRNFTLIPTSMP